jgi:alanine-glyoxylate transaminase/serine-glyoxylate transaminase/serine-pyruvate transaminase
MKLDHGRHYMAIPGPSVMPDRVLQAMHRPAPNIYTGALVDLTDSLIPDLKTIAGTQHHAAIYIANGHGVWEAALTNTLSRGDKVLVLGTGRFCLMWGKMANGLGIESQVIDFGPQSDIDMTRVATALQDDTDHKIKAVLAVHVDTSTSVKNDIQALRKTLDAAGHPALLMSDNIACLGCDEFHMDDWGVDVMVTGSQKGLMTPPGMGFVFFNPRADQARDHADLVTPYWDWRPRSSPAEFYQYFFGTAPTHHLYGLREALTMIVHEEGLASVWARHAKLARAVWAAVETWGMGGDMRLNIADPAKRSHAVTTVNFGNRNAHRLRNWTTQQAGVTLGIPLAGVEAEGSAISNYLRIGHMGHINPHMVLGVIASLQAAMIALDIAHNPGGVDAAARVLAD